ncbi:MAG: hypothetical protein KAZ94_03825 [Burkholderiales bacterium]|nr:hypothetical protein [Burkholderiales bacterium]MBP9769230.1 hypothetical protein [Burkholderiales bacterium]
MVKNFLTMVVLSLALIACASNQAGSQSSQTMGQSNSTESSNNVYSFQ